MSDEGSGSVQKLGHYFMAQQNQFHVTLPYFMSVPTVLKWLPIGQLDGCHMADAMLGRRVRNTIDGVAIWDTPGISVAEMLSGLAVARRNGWSISMTAG